MVPSLAMAFTHQLTARFFEIDRAGIVFFGRFYEYCHVALEEVLAAMFGHPAAIFESLGFGMPLVHSEADYSAPTRMGDKLTIEVTIERLGRRSVTFAYRIVGTDDGIQRCTVTLVHAFVNMETFTGIDVPQDFIDGLQRVGLHPA